MQRAQGTSPRARVSGNLIEPHRALWMLQRPLPRGLRRLWTHWHNSLTGPLLALALTHARVKQGWHRQPAEQERQQHLLSRRLWTPLSSAKEQPLKAFSLCGERRGPLTPLPPKAL